MLDIPKIGPGFRIFFIFFCRPRVPVRRLWHLLFLHTFLYFFQTAWLSSLWLLLRNAVSCAIAAQGFVKALVGLCCFLFFSCFLPAPRFARGFFCLFCCFVFIFLLFLWLSAFLFWHPFFSFFVLYSLTGCILPD